MSVIIDRRPNDRSGSAVNRERFMRRYRAQIRKAVADMVADRSIRDMERGGTVGIPVRDLSEPSFRHGHGGDREYVHPGNRDFQPGDRLPRPSGGDGGGNGDEGGSGDGVDEFSFTLSREEFMQIFFDDLELPRLARTALGEIREHRPQRAGYARHGTPANLAVARSLRNALGRRLALTAGARRELARAAGSTDGGEPGEAGEPGDTAAADAAARIALLERRIARVPFLEEIDLRYRHRTMVAQPVARAVMFCLMDVSASMDQHKKDLAKRFFALLHLFLARKYEHVDVVFIRHTDDAEEVDEEHFFHDRKTGGTVVMSALALMNRIVGERYAQGGWNVYGAQASDGDAFGADPEKSRGFLESTLLPRVRHFAYIEVSDEDAGVTTLSAAYRRIEAPRFAMREVREARDIWPVFRGLFRRAPDGAATARA
ncbi:MAG: YeaH/YhbH family protein [Burkholderiaceae bacterium]|nr:YeaH/YhbH family protein [Burkholderiaceae bacterium]